jgi:hypothetical protein
LSDHLPPESVITIDRNTHAILLVDGHEIEFELKSVTTARASVSTVRDLGPDHISKWHGKHWIIAFYDELDLRHCKYGTPEQMAPWISEKSEYIRVDLAMAEIVPGLITADVMTRIIGEKELYTLDDARKLHKNQYSLRKYRSLMDYPNGYSIERMLEIFRERATYIIERGSTLNNPHIPLNYFDSWETITDNHAATLRELVRRWRASMSVQHLVRDDTP